ncbi:SMC-Scp complex subunit ScpB [Desertihabitans aurantiacus]|uniref:SMC-Scp complex subunit ScpB n=1 Tax=Desertihabitans aurantiacus TaxID=2282477 RepID=UPI000DF80677|nr:SMC-Scp complex subunit ScpB [Desertihabitans aurantiacus]
MSEHPAAEGQTVHPDLVGELSGPVEALLLMADEPMSSLTLAQALQAPVEAVEQTCRELRDFYDRTGRGFELRHLAGGWRYWTREEHAEVISRAVLEGQQSRLSQAALETLAVVAYLQPISRARISAVRGVNVDGVVRTLVAREMIEEAGQDPVTGAVVFRTTDTFCERIGLESLDQLPDLAPHLPDASTLEAELGQLAAVPPAGTTTDVDQLPDEPAADETLDDEMGAPRRGDPPAPAGGTEEGGRP